MNILFVADIFPELTSGSAVRNFYLLKALSQKNKVHLIALTDNIRQVNTKMYENFPNFQITLIERAKLAPVQRILHMASGRLPYIEIRKKLSLPNHIHKKLSSFDLIHLAELNSYFFMEKYLKKITVPVSLDAHNVEYIRLADEIKNKSIITRFISNTFLGFVKKQEIAAARNSTVLLVCSVPDKRYFSQFIPAQKITIIPNGVNIKYFSEYKKNKVDDKIIILFMGLLSYFPNDEALQYYFKAIDPVIKEKFPKREVYIIGRNAPEWLIKKSRHTDDITLTGFVDDIRPYIADATVCIAPLQSGSGTRLKILEYMAMKKAVITTDRGIEGIKANNENEIYIAKNTNEFVQAMILLLNNKNIRLKVGENAHLMIAKNYEWGKIGAELNAIYAKIKI